MMAKADRFSTTRKVQPGVFISGLPPGSGNLFVLFIKRDYSGTKDLSVRASLEGGWKFVGASYDHSSGEAKLWVNGAAVQTLNIGAGLELATQDVIRMGVRSGDGRCFKGRIAQMRIYNRALSQEQIQAIQKLVAGNEKIKKIKKSKFECSLQCEK